MIRKGLLLLLLGALAYLTYAALAVDRFWWDLPVTRWLQKVDPDSLGPIPNLLFYMGLKGVGGVSIVAAAVWLWYKRWRAEAFFMSLIAIPDFFNVWLRSLIDRPRPSRDLVIVFGGPQGGSFPSGYAMHVTLFCGFIIYLTGDVLKPGFWRTALRVILWAYIPLVGLWLAYDGRHWTSDILGGYVYGSVYLAILVWGYQKYVAWRRKYPHDYVFTEEAPLILKPFAWILTIVK